MHGWKSVLTLLPAALCLTYYLILILYAGISADFSWIWLFFAGMFLAARLPAVGRFVLAAGVIGAAGMLLLLIPILKGMYTAPGNGLHTVIVEGAQVKGDVPSKSLLKRLERALTYAQDNPDSKLILSGGKGSGEQISEAECMYTWLLDRGIPSERMVMEDRSTSTEENLRFSDELTGCAENTVGLITNDFHIYRSLMLAKKLGYREVYGIPASSDPVLLPHFTVREIFALAYGLVKKV